ncbi:hypothetical protein ACKE5C_09680 [Aneurinibacillus thermoaerophilus]
MFYSFFVGIVIYKTIKWGNIPEILLNSALFRSHFIYNKR